MLRELAIGFTIWLIGFNFMLAFLFYRMYFQKDKQYRIILGLALFFQFVAISRIFYMIFDHFDNQFLYWKTATIFILIGLGFFLAVADYNLWQGRDKFLPTIAYVVLAIVIIYIPDFSLAEQVSTYGVLIPLLFIPFSYIYVAIKAMGEVRRKSLLILAGIVIYGVGLLLLVQFIIGSPGTDFFYTMHIISVGVRTVGGICLYYGFR
ncbi:MAG: hypothetical protein ACTSRS_04730 [Candidatus Helarchaeota archaeon]